MTAPATYRARTVDDLINTLPTTFGFVPRESIIGICVSGPRHRLGFTARIDLPVDAADAPAVAELLVHHLGRHDGDGVIIVALSADPALGEEMVHRVRELLPTERPAVLEAWATDDRWWTAHPACPPEGEPYRLSATHEARIRAAAEGVVVLEDRDALLREIEPAGRPRRDWYDRAFADALLSRLPEGPAWRREHVAEMGRLLDRGRWVDGDLIAMSALTQWIPGRDAARARISRDRAREMYDLWSAAVRVVGGVASVPMLSLAGFAAWRAGDGARAINALDRARELDDEYTLAGLLGRVVEAGLDPRVCDELDTTQWTRASGEGRPA